MGKNEIISTLRQKFIDNTDVGLLFNLKPEDFNTEFKFPKTDEQFLDAYYQGAFWDEKAPSKRDILFYLSYIPCKYLSPTDRKYFRRTDFHSKFWKYWTERFNNVKALIEKVPDHFAAETIGDKDLVYINVTEVPTVIIFIITSKNIITLNINAQGKNKRTKPIISKDIKKIEATDSTVVLHYHGQHEAEAIETDSAKSAIKLQDHLTNLRDNNK